MVAPVQRAVDDPENRKIDGYRIADIIRAGPRSIAYRGRRERDGQRVVIKLQRDPYPSDRDIAAETRAFEIAREHDDHGLARHLDLVSYGHGRALITEDFGASSLDLLIRDKGRLPVAEAVEISRDMAAALARLHGAGIVHNDVSAANALWATETCTLRLIDLKECSLIEREEADVAADALSDAALVYAAPERTGRLARPVDARSDLYSLGVVLFELLAGRPPFVHEDPRELVHAHLARQPPSVDALAAEVPAVVAAIVARLLAKNPDDRYGSAHGLAHDLTRCLDGLREGACPDFPLGEADSRSRFAVPERLYGRDAERRALLGALDRVRAGQPQLVLINGYSGIGKSALAGEVRQAVAEGTGWYCTGKFDQFLRDVPYLAWQGALAGLARQLLAEPGEQQKAVRADLEGALGGNGCLVADLVPEFAELLGAHPDIPDVSPAEAQARFVRTLTSLLQTLATPERPLVVFIDDLQWADLASLQILEALAIATRAASLLVLGAYRDNEVGPGHPVTGMLQRLAERDRKPPNLELRPLGEAALIALVGDTVQRHGDEAAKLARMVHEKTGGNPFFVRRFLTELHRKGHLRFEHGSGRWVWDQRAIAAAHYTVNVVSLMTERIDALPADLRAILQYASCLGVGFDLRTLVQLTGDRQSAVARRLEQAVGEGLIVPAGHDYRLAVIEALLAEQKGEVPQTNPRFRFLHDRVQQSVHDGIEPDARADIHVRIARSAVGTDQAAEGGEVAVMDHLAECQHLLTDPAEKLVFARVCLAAARRAMASMATRQAVRYAQMGIALLPAEAWEHEERLAFGLNLQAAEAFYVDERFDDARRAAEDILARTDDLQDRVAAHNVLIGIGVSEQRFVDATNYAIGVLDRELDVHLPRAPTMVHVLGDLTRTRLILARRGAGSLGDLPAMTDVRWLNAMAMLMKSATNAYWGNPNLVPIIAGTMVRLSLRHGNTGLSAYGYALIGMVLTHALGAVRLGYELGRFSMELLDRTGDRHLVGKTGLLWHGFIRHSTDPLRVCASDVLDCYDRASDAGDVENAVYCGTVAYYADLLAGRPLDWIEERYRHYLPALLGSAQQQTILALKVWMQVADNLKDGDRAEARAVGAHIEWPGELDRLLDQPGSDMTIATIAGGPGWLAFLLDDMDEAERQLSLLYERRQAAMGQAFLKPCLSLYALVLARKFGQSAADRGERLRLARLRRWIRAWARRNPHDYRPFDDVLTAELAAARGRSSRALASWSHGMERAREAGLTYLEAWAAERAARAQAEAGLTGLARHFWDRARQGWARAGIRARLAQLDRAAGQRADIAAGMPTTAGKATGRDEQSHDVTSVLDAVRAVSEIVEVDKLITRVLRILLVSAGARRGTLLVEDNGLRALASAQLGEDGEVTANPENQAPNHDWVAMGLVDHVVRTKSALAVDDARTHEWLSRDPYVARVGARSLLGAPLMRHGRLVGLVVLENDLGPGVFTPSALTVATLIAGQAAVSLENARLFEAQRRRTEAFARFVPRPFLEHMGHSQIEDVSLGDAVQQDITVMFADLRRSTSLSETMSVSDYFGLINALLAELTPVVGEASGFIDGFTGDGYRAIFIGPSDKAVASAIAMQRRLRRYNEARVAKGRKALAVGIGLHTGPALLGTIGVTNRMSTTVIGDTVNTASRLEGLTKFYGAPVLISHATRAALADPAGFAIREVGRDRVQGHRKATIVHEVIDARARRERESLGATAGPFALALAAYFARDFAAARDGFAACAERAPDDGLARHYRDLTQTYLRDGVPNDWDGVNRRLEK